MARLACARPHELLVIRMRSSSGACALNLSTKPKAQMASVMGMYPSSPTKSIDTMRTFDATPLVPKSFHSAPMMPAVCVPCPIAKDSGS